MDRYFVIGNPVEHSRSPQIHARFAALTGQALDYRKHLAPLDGFAAALATLQQAGACGANVTVPFKFEAFAAAQSTSARAQLAQAANTLKFNAGRIHADNTDGAGLVNDIEINAGFSLSGRDVLLLGAGGAAAGVLGRLIEAGPQGITVANRTLPKAEALVARHAQLAAQWSARLAARALTALEGDFDVVINATASSLAGAALPVGAGVLRKGALVYDMMYGPAAQPFMDWATAYGATARDGLGMLVEQAAESFYLWRGVRPPSAQVLREMREAMA